jgi:hypothetical protein
MAFGKKYYSSYKSNNNIDYYLEIWLKDYDSTASEITIGAGGPIITYETEEDDRFSPILSSNCRLPLMVTNTALQTFVSQLRTTYQEKQVYLHLYKATSSTYTTTKPIWSGFLTMDLGSGEDVSFPYEQELIFVDGLSLLKEIDFVDFSDPDYETRTAGNYAPENMYWGPARYTYWIKEILLKSGAAISGVNGQGVTQDYGFTTAVNWYNGTMTSTSQSSDPLYLTECKASMFHTKDENETFLPDNCYDVLKELLRHWGARITYWKHEFWIVQIPEYIVDESGFIDNPDNINSRQYNKSGTYLGSQDHLGDTYSSRYEQTIQSDQISKLVGTKYNYLPAIHRVNAKFLSLNGDNHFGGFPFGANPYGIDFFQSRIANPSSADFLWVSIPLNWKWDMSGTALPNGHTNGWWARIRFNLYCTQNNGGTITTYYLQYKSSNDSYYWVDSSNWTPLGNESPAYIISSRNLVETDYIGFQEQIEFVDSSGSSIALTGDWDFYMSIENYGTSANNPGSFYCRFSGYNTGYVKRNPDGTAPSLPAPGGGGASTGSGTVSWSNSLQDNSIAFNSPTASSTNYPSGYNTGASQLDKSFTWKSPLKGFLQVLSNTVNATYGITNDTIVSNSSNTEVYGFGDLLFGDCIVETARGNLNVWNGSSFTKTNVNGKWGRGILTGEKTFTQMLIDEFLTGQIQVVISPSMRLVVGEQNKNQTATASGGGTATRPRYVNPIGRLRETRSNETDPEYFFRRGSFHTLYDEWDYEGYQILRDTITVTTNTNDIGSLGGSQDDNPIDAAKVVSNVETALMMNSPVAYVRTTVPATGSNVIVNGNFNVATGWTLGTGWTIDTTTKKAKFAATGSTSDLVQSVLTTELTYQINFTVEVTAGSLIVKAGSSGTSQTITTSGDYSIYLDCEGSTDIKFTAGTTFTGNITYITAKDQKSISSIPINVIGSTVFKTNDTLDLINSRDGEIMTLNVSSNQGASDDTISVTSTPLFEDVAANSVLLINQDDLSAQYQNKTKGTVGGFDITATSIDSGSVAISSYIDDDSFGTASATSLATSESIKAYVDTQVGSADTLQEVTDNGNTTTNSIMIGSSSSPTHALQIEDSFTLSAIGFGGTFLKFGDYSGIGYSRIWGDGTNMAYSNNNGYHKWMNQATELMRLTSGGYLGIGTTNPNMPISIENSTDFLAYFKSTDNKAYIGISDDDTNVYVSAENSRMSLGFDTGVSVNNINILSNGNTGFGTVTPTEKLHVVGDALITGDSHADAFKPAVSGNPIKFKNFDSSTEFARITSGGNLLINNTSGTELLEIHDIATPTIKLVDTTNNANVTLKVTNWDAYLASSGRVFVQSSTALSISTSGNVGVGISSPVNAKFEVVGNSIFDTATFSGQVTIPATPVASTDAASKGYVDAQIGANNDLQEVTDNGNTTTNSIVIGSGTNSAPALSFDSDSNTGVYRASENIVGLSGGGIGLTWDGIHLTTSIGGSFYLEKSGSASSPTYAFQSYTSTGMFRPAGLHAIGFSTNGSEKMRLTSDGKLGIGVTNPDQSLHIESSLDTAIKVEKTGGNYIQLTAGGAGGRITSDSQINFDAGGNSGAMLISSSGNVGIGTSPSAKLEVSSDSNVATIINSTSTFTFIDIENDGANRVQIGNASDGDFIVRTDELERTRITSDGRLGIGTSSPQSGFKLDINGASVTRGDIYLLNSINHFGTGDFNISAAGSNTIFKISGSEKMRLTSTGRLGLGTTSPNRLFQVKKTDGTASIAITSSNTGIAQLELGGTSDNDIAGVTYNGNTSMLSLKTNNTGQLYVTNGGNVLIGTTTDTGFKLNVSGSITTAGGSANITAPRHIVADSNAMIYRNNDNLTLLTYQSKNITFMPNNSESVRFLANGNVLIGTTTDSGYKLTVNGDIKLNDNTIRIGSSSFGDLKLYHSTNSFLQNDTGDLYITQTANDKDIIFQSDDGSGGVTSYITLDGSNTTIKIVKNTFVTDNTLLGVGDDSDLRMFHNGTNSFIDNYSGDFYIRQRTDDKDLKLQCDDGSGGVADYITLDGSQTTVNVSQNLLINTTTDAGVPLYVNGVIRAVGGGIQAAQDYGFTLNDESGSNRYGLKFGAAGSVGGSNLLMLTNRSFSSATGGGEVAIGGNTNTTGVTEVEIARFQPRVAAASGTQKMVTLESVLKLKEQGTPADPSSGEAVIWLDNNYDLKVKITGAEGTVTRTLAQYEG